MTITKTESPTDPYLHKKISLYSNYREIGAGVTITIGHFFEGVRSNPDWQRYAMAVRAATDWNQPKPKHTKGLPQWEQPMRDYDRLKLNVPCATISGRFSQKSDSNTYEPTDLIAIDLDHLDDRVDEVKAQLLNDQYVYAVFKSIGGRGLCIVIKIDHKRHKDSFDGLIRYLLVTYQLTDKGVIDKSVSNTNRLRLVTHDPELVYNPDSKVFRDYIKRAESKQWIPNETFADTDTDILYCIKQIEERRIEFTDSSAEWVRIGYAFSSKFDSAGLDLFQRVSQFRHDYDTEQTAERYRYWCKTKNGSINIATFFFICKQHGLSVVSPSTAKVLNIARMHQKQKIPASDCIKSIVTQLKTDPAYTKEVVEQSYNANGSINSGDSDIAILRAFFRANYDLHYNQVTFQFEEVETGVPYDDKKFKAMYIHAKEVLDEKLRFDTVMDLLDSDTVFPVFNPFRNFFEKYGHIESNGLIYKLISTIQTDTSFIEEAVIPYVYVFLRKWLIGIVATIFSDDTNSLVPIFTGKEGTGKSWWFRHLLPEELRRYHTETKWADDRDELRRMCTSLISYNDEFKGKDIRAVDHIKSLASSDYFTIRLMFGRHDIRAKRYASMCASSNPKDVINEPEFNRRIIPINVISINWALYSGIDRVKLFVELYRAYISGESYQLTRDEMVLLKSSTESFQNKSYERQLIEQHLSIPQDEFSSGVEFLTTTDIKSRLESKTMNSKLSLEKIGSALSATGFIKSVRKINNKKLGGYFVIIH